MHPAHPPDSPPGAPGSHRHQAPPAAGVAPVRRLLVGYDGSVPAREALRAAATLLRSGGECTVLSVAPQAADAGTLMAPSKSTPPHIFAWTEEAALIFRRLGATATLRVAAGDPASVLPRAVQEEDADLLILGHHGREARRPPVLGEVARRLIAHAPCPILVAGTNPVTAIQRVLVALTSAPVEETTIAASAALVRHCGASLLLLQAVEGETVAEHVTPVPGRSRLERSPADESALALTSAVRACERLSIEPRIDVVRGSLPSALSAHVVRLSADVVCLGLSPPPAQLDAIYRDVGAAVLVPPHTAPATV